MYSVSLHEIHTLSHEKTSISKVIQRKGTFTPLTESVQRSEFVLGLDILDVYYYYYSNK